MCGIVGVFNHPEASAKVNAALALLSNRGKDGCGIATQGFVSTGNNVHELHWVDDTHLVGHTLHAVVDHVSQPLRKNALITANCEIYNWQELCARYGIAAKNDADFLLSFLEMAGTENLNEIEKLSELDGVYAFGYWRGDNLTLARDILGEKPIWYAQTERSFAFASEKKVLEAIGFQNILELNPRTVLQYDIQKHRISTTPRPFFSGVPELTEPYVHLKEKTRELLENAITKRIPTVKFGLLFSGGVDSTYLAQVLKTKGYTFTCYTAVLDTPGVQPTDLVAAENAAQQLGLDLKIKKISLEQIPSYLRKIVPLIEDSNVTKVGVALPFYLACEMAKEDGCKVIFSGLGSEEIFAGYERHAHSTNVNQECVSGLLKMYERDLYRDDVLTMENNLELRLPFLDVALIDYALKIPEHYKLVEKMGKQILREIALESGVPREFAFRKKTAAQYGSRFDAALAKLAKNNRYESKSSYLRLFYERPNIKLGVLFSSGKDSTAAAYAMKQQNYGLACLITLVSTNPHSYMFQSAGIELVRLQAEAMGLPLLLQETTGEKERELLDLEQALYRAKEEYQIQGIVSGALFSTYQRDRIERICDKLGLKIFSPLWHNAQEKHMHDLLHAGFKIIFTAVAADGLNRTWLNREIGIEDIQKLENIHKKNKLNIAGEGGEFESAVLDCPLFTKRIKIQNAEVVEESKNSAKLIIHQAILVPKGTQKEETSK